MRILILTHSFPPEVRSTSNMMHELAEDLVEYGHTVTVVTPIPRYNVAEIDPKYRGKLWRVEQVGGIRVIRVRSFWIHFVGPVRRGLGQLGLAAIFALAGIFAGRQDVIFAYSPPLTLGLSCYVLARLNRVPYVFNVQDLFPQNAIDLGLLRNRHLILAFRILEKFIYRTAGVITVHSDGNQQYVQSFGTRPDGVRVFENWTDVRSLTYRPGKKSFYPEPEIGAKFTVLFAGVLGYAQDMDVIVDAAKLLRDDGEILFLIVGSGVEKKRMEERCRAEGIGNVIFRDFVPKEEYPALVQSCDVCLATLRKEMKTPVVPSKIIHVMACGRSMIASLDPDGDAAKLVESARCGLCVPPGDGLQLSLAIKRLKEQPGLRLQMQENGYRYALEHFDRKQVTGRYDALFRNLRS